MSWDKLQPSIMEALGFKRHTSDERSYHKDGFYTKELTPEMAGVDMMVIVIPSAVSKEVTVKYRVNGKDVFFQRFDSLMQFICTIDEV